ncbi:MAG: SPOR domain-containing protein [Bacteroidia bacterium]
MLKILFVLLFALGQSLCFGQGLVLVKTYSGNLAPKSIITDNKGGFYAQNMMYEHTISAYERNQGLVKTISDSVKLSSFGHKRFKDTVQGAPCEAALSHNGKCLWVANYAMYGNGFDSLADDECIPNGAYDSSYVFKINTRNFKIENAIQVGCVPKFLQVYKDSLLLVSNWCSGNVSVVSLKTERVIRAYDVKMYPRGLAFDAYSNSVYVAQMGTYEIARINLETGIYDSIVVPGRSPRHLCIDNEKRLLYASLNGSGVLAKIDLDTDSTIATAVTGRAPRSMVLTADGKYLYVVNYYSNTVSKVRASDFKVLEYINTKPKPIGITFDNKTKHIWVSCYEGFVQEFEDTYYGVDSLYDKKKVGGFGIVLNSFGNEHNAENYCAQLNARGIDAVVVSKGDKHRVALCGFTTLEEALLKRKELREFKGNWIFECE